MSEPPSGTEAAAPTPVALPALAIDKFERKVSIVALSVAIIVGAASIAFGVLPYVYVKHDLTVMTSGFRYDNFLSKPSMLDVDLVFANGGNRYEAVMGATFVLPIMTNLSGSHWFTTVRRVRLAPFTLAPGEVVVKRLSQPATDDLLVAKKKTLPDSSALNDDPAHQVVAIEIMVRDPKGFPRSHVVPLARVSTEREPVLGWEYLQNVEVDSTALGGITRLDLFRGGRPGRELFEFGSYRFVTGDPTRAATDSS